MVVGITPSDLGSSRLCGDGSKGVACGRARARRITADSILMRGPQGSPGSQQAARHHRALEREERVRSASALAVTAPDALHAILAEDMPSGVAETPAQLQAQEKLGGVVMDRLRHAFLEASLAGPRSSMRAERVSNLHAEVERARPLGGQLSPDMQNQLRQFEVDTGALQVIAKAQALQQKGRALAANSWLATDEERGRVVGEAMEMLREWKSHSEVALSLCDALVALAELGCEELREEMERRGMAVLASTVADLHRDRPAVNRCALRLLSAVSIELLVQTLEEQKKSYVYVFNGMEALNRRAREGQSRLDEIAYYGGREMIREIEPIWADNKMVSLHFLNLRRRMKSSVTKSVRKRVESQLPPEEVVRLRKCFEAIDEENRGYVDRDQLRGVMQMLGMSFDQAEIEELAREADVDGSGRIEWPEFHWLMSRFGPRHTIEHQFSEKKLKEMRRVFDIFDKDGNGSLDAKELKDAMAGIGLSPTDFELRAMIAGVDADGSGCIEWNEFLHMMNKKVVDPENQHRLAFNYFLEGDTSSGPQSSSITRSCFVSQMRKLTSEFSETELHEMFHQAKFENNDYTRLTYKEFVKMMISR